MVERGRSLCSPLALPLDWSTRLPCNARQGCAIGEELSLVREPKCPLDPAAIGVFRKNGEQLPYLSREFSAGGTAAKMDIGESFQCSVKNIVGGYEGKSFGVMFLCRTAAGQNSDHLLRSIFSGLTIPRPLNGTARSSVCWLSSGSSSPSLI
jgi:hypothetical protein